MTPEELEALLKANGFSTVQELIAAYQAALADKTKAEEARDKFSNDLKAAQETLRNKAGEIGALKQEVEQLKSHAPAAPAPGKAPASPPAAPAKTVEDELSEVEAQLTEEQWAAADALLEGMKVQVEKGTLDAEEAIKVAEDPATRLAFLKGLASDVEVKSLPATFRRKPSSPPDKPEDVYQQIKKRVSGIVPSPSAMPRRAPARGTKEPQNTGPAWLRQ